jgi:hypothetical protein
MTRHGSAPAPGADLALALAAPALAPSVLPSTGIAAQDLLHACERAFALRDRSEPLPVDPPGAPTWIGEGSRFWYSKQVHGGREFGRPG